MLGFHNIKVPLTARKRHPPLGPDSFCATCNTKFSNQRNYRYHISRFHNGPPRTYEPSTFDIATSNCKICDKNYKSKGYFNVHMWKYHNIWLPQSKSPPVPKMKANIKYPNLNADVNDPSIHCAICKKMFSEKSKYLIHLEEVHKKPIPDLREGVRCNGVDNVDISCNNKYCAKCNRVFYTKDLYRIHLKDAHNNTVPKSQLRMPCIYPNSLDPNNYCSPCNMTCSDRSKYQAHLKDYHAMSVKNRATIRSGIFMENPVIDYDINYCNACNKNFTMRFCYRKHLARVHGIPIPMSCRNFLVRYKGSLEIDESNLRCRVCNDTFSCQLNYRNHLKSVHHVRDTHDRIMSDRESGTKFIYI